MTINEIFSKNGDFMKTTFTGFVLSLFSVGILFIAASTVNAATFVVNDPNDVQDATAGDGICATAGAVCTLRAAITEANALAGADIITLPAGTYTQTLVGSENLNASGDLDITSDITINGAGSGTTIIQANALPGTAVEKVLHCITAATAVFINDVTIQNGNSVGTNGAGIRLETATTNVTFNRVLVTNNRTTTSGGGITIATAGATLIVVDSTISNNQSGGLGGGVNVSATATVSITGTTITGNTATSTTAGTSGGAVAFAGAGVMTINNSTVSNNLSTTSFATGNAFSGGVHITGGTTTITGTTITGNTARVTAGTGAALVGGVYNQQATVNITDSNITNNSAVNTVTPATSFHAAVRTLAGTIAATTTITNCIISGNTAGGDGGGVVNIPSSTLNSTTNIINSNIFSNTSTAGAGGGVLNSNGSATATAVGAVNITNSTIRNNTAVFGAGIMNQISATAGVGMATITLTRSTVNGNTATGNGGGAYNISFSGTTGTATINSTNSTISGNRGASGGGVTNENGAAAFGATSNFNYTTVASNTATVSGGGLNQSGAGSLINLKNSIVADNAATTSGPDIFGTITSQDYNHVENVSGGTFFASRERSGKSEPIFFVMPNDVTGTDPMLGALANNGGSTLTQLPAVASPVVNTIPSGTSDCGVAVTTSQNAVTRPAQTGCEKGGAERVAPTAADSSIRGRLLTPTGRGLTNAYVVLTDTNTGQVRYARTTSLGYFSFKELETGDFYVLSVSSKRYIFETRSFVLSDNIDDLVLIGQ
jgi:hypothetical protein